MTTGYSNKPLIEKLGFKPSMRAAAHDAPYSYFEEVPLGTNTIILSGKYDFLHLFVSSREKLEQLIPTLIKCIDPQGMLWISWPKKSSALPSDITENVLRELIIPTGLVDVKVCAIDETWSGLKFVWRKEQRTDRNQ